MIFFTCLYCPKKKLTKNQQISHSSVSQQGYNERSYVAPLLYCHPHYQLIAFFFFVFSFGSVMFCVSPLPVSVSRLLAGSSFFGFCGSRSVVPLLLFGLLLLPPFPLALLFLVVVLGACVVLFAVLLLPFLFFRLSLLGVGVVLSPSVLALSFVLFRLFVARCGFLFRVALVRLVLFLFFLVSLFLGFGLGVLGFACLCLWSWRSLFGFFAPFGFSPFLVGFCFVGAWLVFSSLVFLLTKLYLYVICSKFRLWCLC